MNIGSKAASAQLVPLSRQEAVGGSIGGAALQALGRGLSDLGMSQTELAVAIKERDRKQLRANADTGMAELMGQQDRALLEAAQGMAPGGSGFTNGVTEGLDSSFESFAKRIGIADDPTLMNEYKPRWEAFKQDHVTKAFGFEVTESNRYVAEGVGKALSAAQSSIHQDPSLFDQKFADLSATIDKSDLPPVEKEALKKQVYDGLASATFSAETQKALNDNSPVRQPSGEDVVAPGLSPAARGFLNGTSVVESSSKYNIRYDGKGGATFDSYADHPRVMVARPDGRYSSAAGRYQFTASTWDDTVKEMNQQGYNITDFSPVNQDRVAWYLAQKTYAGNTGRSLEADMASGDPQIIAAAARSLKGTWEAFGSEQSVQRFVLVATGKEGIAGGGTGHSQTPDIWTDPRFEGMTYADKMAADAKATEQELATRRMQAAAQAAEEKAARDIILKSIRDGDVGAMQAGQEAIAKGRITDIESINAIDTASKEFRDDQQTTLDVSKTVADGGVLGLNRAADYDTYLKTTKITSGLQDMNENAQQAFIASATQQGQVPPKAMGVVLGQINSHDPKTQLFGMSTLTNIFEQNPGALASQSVDVQKQAALIDTLLKYNTTPQAAIEQYNSISSPEGQAVRDARKAEIDKNVADTGFTTFQARAISSFGQNWVWGDKYQAPATLAANDHFMSSYYTLYRENYSILGDPGAAHDATAKQMKMVWAPDPISGKLMEMSPLSPSMGQTPLNGSYDWIENSVRLQLGEPDAPVSLISDAQTMADMSALGHPTYRAIVLKDGLVSSAPLRVFVDQTPEVINREVTKTIAQDIADAKISPMRSAEAGFGLIGDKIGQVVDAAGARMKSEMAAVQAAADQKQAAVNRSAAVSAKVGIEAAQAQKDFVQSPKGKRETGIASFISLHPDWTRDRAGYAYDVLTTSQNLRISIEEAAKIVKEEQAAGK